MIRNLFCSLVALAIFGCTPKAKESTSTPNKQDKMITIAGRLMKKPIYCGGAPPDEETIREMRRVRPLSGYALYLAHAQHDGTDHKIIKETKTDSEGKFSFSVPDGDYILLSKYHLDATILSTPGRHIDVHDQEALTTWWHKGIADVQPSEPIELTLRERCHLPLGVPGLRYTGPVAP